MKKAQQKKIRLSAGDALIVVDVQNDFLEGGTQAVPGSNTAIPVLNQYLGEFASKQLPIFATRDWHPVNHCSFQTQGGPYPVHCVADSEGAQFPSGLILPPWTVMISKGVAVDREAHSGFEETDLERRLHGHAIRRLFVGGLATDQCVLSTVKAALVHGFSVFLLSDAIRALNLRADDGSNAEAEMLRLGAVLIQLDTLAT